MPLDREYSGNPISIFALIQAASERRLALPEFQRDFRWKPDDIAEYLRTVARRWPCGTFLLLQGPQPYAVRALQGAPPIEDRDGVRMLVLDGQQRITSLYVAFTNLGDETYYVDFAPLLAGAEEFEDEHLKFIKREKFTRTYGDLEGQARAKVAPVHVIADDEQFVAWAEYLSPEERPKVLRIRSDMLPGLKNYAVPCVELEKDVPLAALAKIFETINKTGEKLRVFELMVAKLYPHDFYLKDKWQQAQEEHPPLVRYDVDGMEVLKLIALREHLRQRSAREASGGTEKVRVRGVRQSDVLNLDPREVLESWDWAVQAYVRALAFAQAACGMTSATVMPSGAMMLPLALVLAGESTPTDNYRQRLQRWFWCSVFAQTYGQGANTQAVADAIQLQSWKEDPDATPTTVRQFQVPVDDITDLRRRNEVLLRGVSCLLIRHGARDWFSPGERLDQHSGPLDFHHVFPKKYLANRGIEDADAIVNFTAVSSTTNKSLRNDSPGTAAEDERVVRSAVETHQIDWDLFAANEWERFKTGRKEALLRLIEEATGVDRQAEEE